MSNKNRWLNSRKSEYRLRLTDLREISRLQKRCAEALLIAGVTDVRKRRDYLEPDGSIVNRFSIITGYNRDTQEEFHFQEYKQFLALPKTECAYLTRLLPHALYYCGEQKGIWTGVACLKATVDYDALSDGESETEALEGLEAAMEGRCTVDKVRKTARTLWAQYRKFFTKIKNDYSARLIMSCMEYTARKDGVLQKTNGKLEILVHVHFLLLAGNDGDPTKQRWYKAFLKKFDGGIQKVRSIKAICKYLLKPTHMADLLDNGEYVDWFKSVKRIKRTVFHGSLKKVIKSLETKGITPQLAGNRGDVILSPITPRKRKCKACPKRQPRPILPNTCIGSKMMANSDGSRSRLEFYQNHHNSKNVNWTQTTTKTVQPHISSIYTHSFHSIYQTLILEPIRHIQALGALILGQTGFWRRPLSLKARTSPPRGSKPSFLSDLASPFHRLCQRMSRSKRPRYSRLRAVLSRWYRHLVTAFR